MIGIYPYLWRVKGRRSLPYITKIPPLLEKERGTKGVRLINIKRGV